MWLLQNICFMCFIKMSRWILIKKIFKYSTHFFFKYFDEVLIILSLLKTFYEILTMKIIFTHKKKVFNENYYFSRTITYNIDIFKNKLTYEQWKKLFMVKIVLSIEWNFKHKLTNVDLYHCAFKGNNVTIFIDW